MSDLQAIIEMASRLPSQTVTAKSSIHERILSAYTIEVKESLVAILTDHHEPEVFEQLSHFLQMQWQQVCGTALCYTAIPHAKVTECFCLIADCLQTYYSIQNNTAKPKMAIEFLMPGLVLESYHSDYPNLGPVKLTKLTAKEYDQYIKYCRTVPLLSPEQYLSPDEDTRYQTLLHESKLTQDETAQLKKLERKHMNSMERNHFEVLKLRKKEHDNQEHQQETGALDRHGEWLIPTTPLMGLLGSHILSDSGESLIPITMLLDNKPTTPYGDKLTFLSDNECQRLNTHSAQTRLFIRTKNAFEKLKPDQSHFLGHLSTLCHRLSLYGQEGVGTENDAAIDVYPALLEFYTYYNLLDATQKARIPENLKSEIDRLMILCSQREKDTRAVDLLLSCINTRQTEIAKAMLGQNVLLSSIACSQETMTRLTNNAAQELDMATTTLQDRFNQRGYFGRDDLPITQELLAAMHIDTSIRTQDDLLGLLDLPQTVFAKMTRERQTELQAIISNYQDLVSLTHTLSLTQLDSFLKAIHPPLMDVLCKDMNEALAILVSLELKKFELLFVKLRESQFRFWDLNTCAHAFKNQPEILSKILELSENNHNLVLASFLGQRDIVTKLLNLTGGDKPNHQDVSDALSAAITQNEWDIVTLILNLTGDNKPSQKAVSKAFSKFISFICNLPLTQLTQFLTEVHPNVIASLCKNMHEVLTLLSSLDTEKFELLFVKLRAYQFQFWNIWQCLNHFINKPTILSKILELSDNSLVLASFSGQISAITPLLNKNPNQQTVSDALSKALEWGKWDVVFRLLQVTGGNKPNQEIVSAVLAKATDWGKLQIISLIQNLSGDNKPNQQTVSDALAKATDWGRWDVVTLLLNFQWNNKPNKKTVSDTLSEAARSGALKVIRHILTFRGDNKPNQKAVSDALSNAARCGCLDIVICLIDNSTDNKPNQEALSNALLNAADGGKWDVVTYLLNLPGSNDLIPETVSYALLNAARSGLWEEVHLILNLPGKNKPSQAVVSDVLFNTLRSSDVKLNLPKHNKPYSTATSDGTLSSLQALDASKLDRKSTKEAILGTIGEDKWTVITLLLKLAGDNKPNQAAVSETLSKAVDEEKWGVVMFILKLAGNNKPSIDAVSKTLSKAVDKSQWEVITLLLKLFGELKPNQKAFSEILLKAVDEGRWDAITLLLLQSPEGNTLNPKILSDAIVKAASLGDLKSIQFILNLPGSIKPNQETVSDELLKAADKGNWQIVTLLLQHGDPSQKAVSDTLLEAARSGQLQVVQIILALTGDNKPSQETVTSALSKAVDEEKWRVVTFILKLTGDKKPRLDAVSKTLSKAVDKSQWEVITLLLKLFGDDKPSLDAVSKALSKAADKDRWDIVTLLLLQSPEGNTLNPKILSDAIVKAAFWDDLTTIQLILNLPGSIKPNQETVSNELLKAADKGDWQIVTLLLQHGNPSQEAVSDTLLEAARSGQLEVVQIILALTGDNKPSQEAVSGALSNAARWSCLEVITFLIDLSNQTAVSEALSCAAAWGKWDSAALIFDLTKDNKPNQKAVSDALSYAAAWGEWEAVSLILNLIGHNNPNQRAISDALFYAAAKGEWCLVALIFDLTGHNKPTQEAVSAAHASFVLFIHNLPLTQLELFLKEAHPKLVTSLFNNMDEILVILSSLDPEKFEVLFVELRACQFQFWDIKICADHFKNQPDVLSKVVELSESDDCFALLDLNLF